MSEVMLINLSAMTCSMSFMVETFSRNSMRTVRRFAYQVKVS